MLKNKLINLIQANLSLHLFEKCKIIKASKIKSWAKIVL